VDWYFARWEKAKSPRRSWPRSASNSGSPRAVTPNPVRAWSTRRP
jgi:hypothetical protein